MESVFILWYVFNEGLDTEDELLVGVYSSEGEAKAAIGRLKDKAGFAQAASEFQIHRYKLNHDDWTEGFVTV
jgi:hypothetical protein